MSRNQRTTDGGKGDTPRPEDPRYALHPKEFDMGSLGCKKGHHVFRGTTKCVYCKLSKEELNETS